MLLDGQGDRWNAKPDQLQRVVDGQNTNNMPPGGQLAHTLVGGHRSSSACMRRLALGSGQETEIQERRYKYTSYGIL